MGPAIGGMEMRLAENDEIVVRGPNIFPAIGTVRSESAKVLRDGWFHTGDQGEVDASGNWRIIGRIKNLVVLGSGHNVRRSRLKTEFLGHLPGRSSRGAYGNGRGYLSAIVDWRRYR